jgi:copper(I)-binding protein
MKTATRLLALALFGATMGAHADTAKLQFNAAWIKQLPPSIPLRAGYLDITNPTKQAHRIVAIQSDAFQSVEFHESRLVDDVMRMVQLDAIELPAGQTVALKPGGKHLMLVEPLRPINIGDPIEIIINFADGSVQRTRLEVQQ